jgi:hypothetical protein
MLRAELTLPFGEYFRPGRCIAADVGSGSVQISGDGVIPTSVSGCTAVPVLILRETETTIITSAGDRAIVRPLSADQLHVGVVDDAASAAAAELFPSVRLVMPRLNPANPLPGPALAWGSLDAVVLSRPLDATQMSEALSQGLVIAILSQQPPDDRWPWRREGGCWVLRPPNVGIVGAIGGEAAYAPVNAYQPLQPASRRRQVVLVGVVVSLLVLATLLARGRWAVSLTVVLVVGCALAIEAWRRRQSPIRHVGGAIVVQGELMQRDEWSYSIALRDGRGSTAGEAMPIVLSDAHAPRIGLSLACDANQPRWSYDLKQGAKVAFRLRWVTGETEQRTSSAVVSPLDELARLAYAGRGRRIIAHSLPSQTEPNDFWPTVIVGGE